MTRGYDGIPSGPKAPASTGHERIEDAPTADARDVPLALDGLAYGIDGLDGILVFHLGDAHLYASWVRADAGLRAEDISGSLRDAYRVSQFAARRVAIFSPAGGDRRGEAQNPVVTLELLSRVAILRRVRAHVIASIFEGSVPLGMVRLLASRIAAALEPELPLEEPVRSSTPDSVRPPAPIEPTAPAIPLVRTRLTSNPPITSAYGRRPSRPPAMPRATLTELDRTRRLLMYLESRAPEPHVARLRLALRTGLTPLALEHPEALGADAVVLIETAVEDILGIDRAELRSVV